MIPSVLSKNEVSLIKLDTSINSNIRAEKIATGI